VREGEGNYRPEVMKMFKVKVYLHTRIKKCKLAGTKI